jgi:hypothetical protein
VEAVQLYLWLAKDIIWTQCAFYWGYAAALVLAPSLLLLYRARRNPAQCVTYLVVMAWLSANWWWMVGEVYDCRFHPANDVVEDRHGKEAAVRLVCCIHRQACESHRVRLAPGDWKSPSREKC